MADLFSLMCGTGGMQISEWARMKSYRLCQLWVEGFNRRSDTTYFVGYVLARAAVSGNCKKGWLESHRDYPYKLRDMTDSDDDLTEDGLSEEEQNEILSKMTKELIENNKDKI